MQRTSSTYLKLQLGNEIRKVSKIPSSLSELFELCQTLFGRSDFSASFQNDQGKTLELATDNDLNSFLQNSGQKTCLKIILTEKPEIDLFEKLENLRQSLLESVSGNFSNIEKNSAESTDSLEVLSDLNSPVEVLPEEKKVQKKPKEKKPKKAQKEKKEKKVKNQVKVKKNVKKVENLKGFEQEKILNDCGETVVHDNIICDACDVGPIQGIRYKCTTCHDFDLCSNCESSQQHPHPMIKIKVPMKTGARGIWSLPPAFACIKKAFPVLKPAKKDFKLQASNENYIHEITCLPSAELEITWKIENKGKKNWPAATKVFLDSGDVECEDFEIPEVKAGDSIQLTLKVKAGAVEKVSSNVWRLVIGSKVFGNIRARIRVTSNPKILKLLSMGFTYFPSKKALDFVNGDFDLALSQMLQL
jgi:hypothetical protein